MSPSKHDVRNYSGWMSANFTTFAHFTVSAAM
jgi:hypothetical protein